jgi:CDP-diacylglycerol--glycerol-3-phosphate 3-phosphatidyltransferase
MRFAGSIVLFGILHTLADVPMESIGDHRGVVQAAFWLFVITAATDYLDGYLARRDHHVTAFGRIADPFTDKVLILGAMIFAAVSPWMRDLLPAWIVVIILAREFLVTGIRGYVESVGEEFPADGLGKIKMIVQCIAVGGVLWIHAFPWPDAWRETWVLLTQILVWITLLATVGSGATYVLKARKILGGIN